MRAGTQTDPYIGRFGVFADGWEIFGIARIRRATDTKYYVEGPGALAKEPQPFWAGRERGHDAGGAWAGRRMLAWVFDDSGAAERFAASYRAAALRWAGVFDEARREEREALLAADAVFASREAQLRAEMEQRLEDLRARRRAAIDKASAPFVRKQQEAVSGFEAEVSGIQGPPRLKLTERASSAAPIPQLGLRSAA